jgi:hypothetical protein
MTITVEDGSIVSGANSYNSVADLDTYAGIRGVDLSSYDTAGKELLLLKAMDYIEAQRSRFQGYKVDEDQPLQWPRYDVWIDGWLKSHTSIPRELQYAQLNLALEAVSTDLMPTVLPTEKGPVESVKVGSIEVAYSNSSPRHLPAFAKAEALLAPLYKYNGMVLVRS